MAYPYPYAAPYQNGAGYTPGYYPAPSQPVPDQLAQLRQNQQLQNMQQQVGPQMMQPQNNMIWVQGEAGAKAYLVANGNTVPLWDSEQPYVYIKTVSMEGVPSMRKLRTTDETNAPPQPAQPQAPQIDLSGYVTREELESILAERLKKTATKTAKPKEETDNG